MSTAAAVFAFHAVFFGGFCASPVHSDVRCLSLPCSGPLVSQSAFEWRHIHIEQCAVGILENCAGECLLWLKAPLETVRCLQENTVANRHNCGYINWDLGQWYMRNAKITTEYHVLKLFLHPIIAKWAVINQSTHPHTLNSYLHSYLPISPLSASFHFLSHSPVFSLAWHWGSGSVTSSQQRFVSLGGCRRISANMIWNPQPEIGRFLQTLLALTRLCEVQHSSLSERQTTCKNYNQTQRSVGWCQF